jgi:hypothetical protein
VSNERNNQERFMKFKSEGEKRAIEHLTSPSPSKNIEVLSPSKENLSFELNTFTEMVELPSRGLFYSSDHPLYQKTHIEVKQVTGKEEVILTNKDYIKTGIVLDKFVESLILSTDLKKKIYYENILDGDRAAILINARISAFGSEYAAIISCPNCLERVNFEFNLSLNNKYCGIYDLADELKENYEHLEDNVVRFQLPNSKLIIDSQVSTIKIINKVEKNLKNKKDFSFKDSFVELVVRVNDQKVNTSDKQNLFDSLSAFDIKAFKK